MQTSILTVTVMSGPRSAFYSDRKWAGALDGISQSDAQGSPHWSIKKLRYLIATYTAVCYKSNCLPASSHAFSGERIE